MGKILFFKPLEMEKLEFIAFLIPLLFIMVAAEWIIAHRQGKNYYNLSDVVVNLCCGLLERLFDFFWIIISFFVFTFVHDNFALFSIPNTALTLCFTGFLRRFSRVLVPPPEP